MFPIFYINNNIHKYNCTRFTVIAALKEDYSLDPIAFLLKVFVLFLISLVDQIYVYKHKLPDTHMHIYTHTYKKTQCEL